MPGILQYAVVGAVVVAAAAIVLQLVVLSRLAKSIKVVERKVQDFVGKVDPLVDQAMTRLEDSRRRIVDVSARANKVLAMSRKQLETIDGVLSEAGACARQQMERVDLLFDDVMNRFQEVVNVLHSGLLKPVREINGLVSGLRGRDSFNSCAAAAPPWPRQLTTKRCSSEVQPGGLVGVPPACSPFRLL